MANDKVLLEVTAGRISVDATHPRAVLAQEAARKVLAGESLVSTSAVQAILDHRSGIWDAAEGPTVRQFMDDLVHKLQDIRDLVTDAERQHDAK